MSTPHDSEPLDAPRRRRNPDEFEAGDPNWRDEDGHRRSPIFSGYEAEQNGAFVGGRLVSECDAARIAAGVAECEDMTFAAGWRAAMDGKPPFASVLDGTPPAWLAGWVAYPRGTWVDPYAGFTEKHSHEQRMMDQDDVTREIKNKEAKRRKAG